MSAPFLIATSNARSIARGLIGDAGALTTDAFLTAGFADRTGTLDERYTGGRNLNMWVGGSCHTQHLEKSFSSSTRHNDGFPRG